MWQHMVWVGFLMAGVTLLTQAWAYHTANAHWQSMVFTVLTLSQLANVWRSAPNGFRCSKSACCPIR